MREPDPVAGDRGMGETDRPLELGGVVVASLEHLAVRTQKPDRDGIVGRLVTGQTPIAEAERQAHRAVGKGGQRCQRAEAKLAVAMRARRTSDGSHRGSPLRWDGVAPTRMAHSPLRTPGHDPPKDVAASDPVLPVAPRQRSLPTLGAMAGRIAPHAQSWRLAPTRHHVGFAPGRVTSVSARGMSTGVMLSNVGAPGGTRTRRNDQRPARLVRRTGRCERHPAPPDHRAMTRTAATSGCPRSTT